MPFLVDGGPPVDQATLATARNELPREYGLRVVSERGRKTIIVRVPRAKPDYNYELAVVAFYASLEDVQGANDVLLVGDEKTVRMEPLRLRDHIREQMREDKDVAPMLRSRLNRDFGWTINQSPGNQHHKALVLRLPLQSVSQADEATLTRARESVGKEILRVLTDCQYVYLIADSDFGRVGRRVFVEAVAKDLQEQLAVEESHTANPIHLGYATPGNSIVNRDLPRG
jgi:hypothetical protein